MAINQDSTRTRIHSSTRLSKNAVLSTQPSVWHTQVEILINKLNKMCLKNVCLFLYTLGNTQKGEVYTLFGYFSLLFSNGPINRGDSSLRAHGEARLCPAGLLREQELVFLKTAPYSRIWVYHDLFCQSSSIR